jgi:hypothetical protein
MIFKEKVAIITGAANGIGKAIAFTFCVHAGYTPPEEIQHSFCFYPVFSSCTETKGTQALNSALCCRLLPIS